MSDLHLDGNGVAGLLGEILAVEVTTVLRTCQSCGDRRPLGEHRAYRGAGVVLRCPSCGDVALRLGTRPERLTVELRGAFEVTPRLTDPSAPGQS
jgi:predicted RNA-binding Zn-ribbon protein involved in translation (DUF1610 family)